MNQPIVDSVLFPARALHVGEVATFFVLPQPWARYAAIDVDGSVWVYENKPRKFVHTWGGSDAGCLMLVGRALKDRKLWAHSLVQLTNLDRLAPMRAIDALLDEALEDWRDPLPLAPAPARAPEDGIAALAAAQRRLRWRMFTLMLSAALVLGFIVAMAVTVLEALL